MSNLNERWKEIDNCLKADFEFKGFNKVMSFVNAVAYLANKQNHHPDISLSFKTCSISIKLL